MPVFHKSIHFLNSRYIFYVKRIVDKKELQISRPEFRHINQTLFHWIPINEFIIIRVNILFSQRHWLILLADKRLVFFHFISIYVSLKLEKSIQLYMFDDKDLNSYLNLF